MTVPPRDAHNGGDERSLRADIADYDIALRRDPNDTRTRTFKGIAYHYLGDLYMEEGRVDDAAQAFRDAIATHEAVHAIDRRDAGAVNNRGMAYESLAAVQAAQGNAEAAVESYDIAIATYDAVVGVMPQMEQTQINKLNSMYALANLYVHYNQIDRAKQLHVDAVASADKALEALPKHGSIYNARALSLNHLADLRRSEGYFIAARTYAEALATLEDALYYNPDNTPARNNQSATLRMLGDLHAENNEYDAAYQAYTDSLAASDETHALDPDIDTPLINRALTLKARGILNHTRSPRDARDDYDAALVATAAALRLVPEQPDMIENRRAVLVQLNRLK